MSVYVCTCTNASHPSHVLSIPLNFISVWDARCSQQIEWLCTIPSIEMCVYVQYYRQDSKRFGCKLKSHILYILKIDINSYEIWRRSHVQRFICGRMLSLSFPFVVFVRASRRFNPKKATSKRERATANASRQLLLSLAALFSSSVLSRLIVAHVNHCRYITPTH